MGGGMTLSLLGRLGRAATAGARVVLRVWAKVRALSCVVRVFRLLRSSTNNHDDHDVMA
jgi:hypothetical protein